VANLPEKNIIGNPLLLLLFFMGKKSNKRTQPRAA